MSDNQSFFPSQPLLITVDGPAGAGKTSVSKILAQRLSYTYVDTGALYRGVAIGAKRAGIQADDDAGLAGFCKKLHLCFEQKADKTLLLMNGEDITSKIREPEISMLASAVSANPVVRKFLLNLQKKMGEKKETVFEGRDMGTVVFPDADIKFFLDASIETRAARRYEELKEQTCQSPADVKTDMKRRDTNDSTRDLAPLKPADDSILINSTHLSLEAVIEKIMECIKTAFG
ncbi:(d)CMP kinase [Desulfobacterales bacterium HSG16]|nr:(d)CMP kinase [Desulfobacterales bacterium HSG16]